MILKAWRHNVIYVFCYHVFLKLRWHLNHAQQVSIINTTTTREFGWCYWRGVLWGTVNVQLKRSPSSFCLDHRGWDNHISGRWEVDSGVKAGRAMARLIPLLLREKRATLALCGGWEKPYFPRSEFTCMVTHRSWSFDAYYEETIGTWQVPLLFFFS